MPVPIPTSSGVIGKYGVEASAKEKLKVSDPKSEQNNCFGGGGKMAGIEF